MSDFKPVPTPDDADQPPLHSQVILELIEYRAPSVIVKTVLKKVNGNISVATLTEEEIDLQRVFPFDTFGQLISGDIEITMDDQLTILSPGHGISIPANKPVTIRSSTFYTMIFSIIR